MAIDDNPIEVTRRMFDLEDTSSTPFAGGILKALHSIPKVLPFPLDKLIDRLKEEISADAAHRLEVMMEVCGDEVIRHGEKLKAIESRLDEQQAKQRTQAASELLLDASRLAVLTRSVERVRLIGLILANGILPEIIDADETEEMMRIAMELSNIDVFYMRQLVVLEGAKLQIAKRIVRYDAHTIWECGSWGTSPDGELDSVFSKLESYGLVSRLAPPNNQNIMADFQNRYVLLQKGMRFVSLISSKTQD